MDERYSVKLIKAILANHKVTEGFNVEYIRKVADKDLYICFDSIYDVVGDFQFPIVNVSHDEHSYDEHECGMCNVWGLYLSPDLDEDDEDFDISDFYKNLGTIDMEQLLTVHGPDSEESKLIKTYLTAIAL